MTPTDLRFVDNIFASKRLKRRTVLNVPHCLVVPQVLAQTNHLIIMLASFLMRSRRNPSSSATCRSYPPPSTGRITGTVVMTSIQPLSGYATRLWMHAGSCDRMRTPLNLVALSVEKS